MPAGQKDTIAKTHSHALKPVVGSESDSVPDACGSESADRDCSVCPEPLPVVATVSLLSCVRTGEVSKVGSAVVAFEHVFECAVVAEHAFECAAAACPHGRVCLHTGSCSGVVAEHAFEFAFEPDPVFERCCAAHAGVSTECGPTDVVVEPGCRCTDVVFADCDGGFGVEAVAVPVVTLNAAHQAAAHIKDPVPALESTVVQRPDSTEEPERVSVPVFVLVMLRCQRVCLSMFQSQSVFLSLLQSL